MGSWWSSSYPPTNVAGHNTQAVVKVITYNILASCFAHHLKYVSPKFLHFPYRRKRIVQTI